MTLKWTHTTKNCEINVDGTSLPKSVMCSSVPTYGLRAAVTLAAIAASEPVFVQKFFVGCAEVRVSIFGPIHPKR